MDCRDSPGRCVELPRELYLTDRDLEVSAGEACGHCGILKGMKSRGEKATRGFLATGFKRGSEGGLVRDNRLCSKGLRAEVIGKIRCRHSGCK